MVKNLEEWVRSDISPYREKPLSWLSQYHFFRDPTRPAYSDPGFFFSPADGVLLYQRLAKPDEPVVDVKGRPYTPRDALCDPAFDRPALVIGIFMTFFDVHVNRVPYSGRLSHRFAEPISTHNLPMLDMEKHILDDLRVDLAAADYLHRNQRVVNRFHSARLGQDYYVLQIADQAVNRITPFDPRQNRRCRQGQRFSQIRYGSQCDLVIPLSDRFGFEPVQRTGRHVEAGVDPLVRVRPLAEQEEGETR
ncbi:phosphatidylserine decarboxylase [Streptoalloteichus hindustanus]|uniref:Phosphatidylserine decarboxylase n=1 Tax=Streptoalloteichus hindustanus TaxID=2017 RepID=A0A1M5NKP1_STRHI|nr:phosphatidylserine decarboxylase [Streptoalloteichus hindustanus]SHG90078.1 phosphatidylserine decarboxylase [Streptoalloteichus hindustanus]